MFFWTLFINEIWSISTLTIIKVIYIIYHHNLWTVEKVIIGYKSVAFSIMVFQHSARFCVSQSLLHLFLESIEECKPCAYRGLVRGQEWDSGKTGNTSSKNCTTAHLLPVYCTHSFSLSPQHELYIRAYHMLSDFPAVSAQWPNLYILIHTQPSHPLTSLQISIINSVTWEACEFSVLTEPQ